MKLAKINNKQYGIFPVKVKMVYVLTKGPLELIQKHLKKTSAGLTSQWNSELKLLDWFEKHNIELSEKEKRLRMILVRNYPKQICFEHSGFVEILAEDLMPRSPYSAAKIHSRNMKQKIVVGCLHINKSRWRKYHDTFTFGIYVVDGEKLLTEGRIGRETFLPNLECLNDTLKCDITKDELCQVWELTNAEQFISRFEALFNIRIFCDDAMLKNEFDCLKETMWYGIYKENPVPL